MFKISQAEEADGAVTFKLEGRLVGPWVGELTRLCEPYFGTRQPIRLDLADISFADTDGVAALSHLKSRGVLVFNCTPFVEQQLKNPAVG